MPSRESIANEEDRGDQPALFDTSVEIFRYLVVISPSQEMIEEVARLKAKVAAAIGSFRGDRSIAHMTLLYAYLPIEYERDLIDGISRAVGSVASFSVQFSGIHKLQDNSTTYIDPIEKEPIIALRGGADGLQFIRPLIEHGWRHLAPGGMLAIEFAESTSDAVVTLAQQQPHLRDARIERDFQGRPRVLIAHRCD